MAGETPPPPNQTDIINQATAAQKELNSSTTDYNDLIGASNKLIHDFGIELKGSGISLENLGKIAANQPGIFTGLGNAVIKAQDAFSGFNGVIKPEGVMTFSQHLDDLRKMFASGSLAGDKARETIADLREQFKKGGGAVEAFDAALRKGTGAAIDLTKNLFANADRAIASQEAILTMAASTGQLGDVTAKAGQQLQNMNVLLDMYNEVITNSKGETNTTVEQINSFATSLQKIPGAMNSVISVGVAGGKQMSSLSAMVKLAHGTHRDFNSVVDDVKKSMVNYGSSLQDSMNFTSRMSELTNKLHGQFDDVKTGLMSVTDAFSKMTNAGAAAGKMQEGISQMMADYVSRLEATGMPAKQAIELVAGLGQQFSQLSITQKAFLSAQTGGPGGLMGGFQIEKMVREGDVSGLRKKMMDLFQKQFGNQIVTLEDATKSQGAASQLQRQTALLRQGPMGQMFKTDDDAHRFMEAMKAEKEGKALPGDMAKGLDSHGLENTIKAGSTMEAKTHTKVSDIATHTQRIRNLLEVNSLGGVQKALTNATMGKGEERDKEQQDVANDLESTWRKFGLRATSQAKDLHTEFGSRKGSMLQTDRRQSHTKDAVDDFVTDMKQLPTVLASAFDTMQKSMSSGHVKKAASEERALAQDIEDRRAAAARKGLPKEKQQELLATAQMEEDKLEEYKKWRAEHFAGKAPTPTNIPALPRGTTSPVGLGTAPRGGVQTAGGQVGAARRPAPGRTATTGGDTSGTPDVQPNVQINKSSGRINVNVHVDVTDKGGQPASSAPQGGTHRE